MNGRKIILDGLRNANVAPDEISAEANFIMQKFLKVTNFYVDFSISEIKVQELNEIFKKRKAGLPLQYILEVADFMGEDFYVNSHVLIPRPETEILVLEAIKKAQKLEQPKILDIGTGSGCIPISIAKKMPNAEISACDISEKALAIAIKNAQKNNLNINFIHSNLFDNIKDKFDIIISNPPYIPIKDKETLQKEVLKEPELALFASDKNGVEFYEKIIKTARNFLNPNGYILFELGIHQSQFVKTYFEDYNFNEIEIIKDLNSIDRVILAKV